MHNDIPYKNNPMGYYTELNNIQPVRAFVSPGHTFNNETVGLEFHFYCDFLDNNKVVLVDWGDGSVGEYDTNKISHTYSSKNNYEINIKGNYIKLRFGTLLSDDPNYDTNDIESAKLLTDVNMEDDAGTTNAVFFTDGIDMYHSCINLSNIFDAFIPYYCKNATRMFMDTRSIKTGFSFKNIEIATDMFKNSNIETTYIEPVPNIVNADGMFLNCSALNDAINVLFSPVLSSANYTYSNCTNLTYVNNNGILSNKLVSAKGTFNNCTNLPIELSAFPDNLNNIDNMFSNCHKAKLTISKWPKNFSNNEIIGTFYQCNNSQLNFDSIPASVTKFNYVFCGDTSATLNFNESYDIPESIEELDHAFTDCPQLVFDCIKLPDNLKNMDNTFAGCTSTVFNFKYSLPNSITNMNKAFYDCENAVLEFNTLPTNLVNMEGTFSNCKNASLIFAEFPSGVTGSLNETFYNCINSTLTFTVLPSKCTSLNYTFANCSSSIMNITSIPSGVTHLSHTFEKCTNSIFNISELPEVCVRMDACFCDCPNLTFTATSLPPNVKIVDQAFRDCSNTVFHFTEELPDSIVTMGEMFFSCRVANLRFTKLPNNCRYMSYAFANCEDSVLTISAWPANSNMVGDMNQIFMGCKNSILAFTEIPSSAVSIGYMFDYCEKSKLNITSLPNSITKMDGAFFNCLQSTFNINKLPDKITTMHNTFGNDTGLTANLNELASNAPTGGYSALTNIQGAFYKCTGVTGSRSTFMSACPNVTNDTDAFYATNTTD